MGVSGTWDRRNNELLGTIAAALAAGNALLTLIDTPVVATSGNVANDEAVATIPAVEGKIAHLVGFRITGLGATAADTVDVTITGVAGDDLTFPYTAIEGATLANTPLDEKLATPAPAPDDATDIVITCPALGAGNTHNQIVAFGIYRDVEVVNAGDTPIVVTSGNVADDAAVATIPAVEGKIAHLTAIQIEGLGATAADTVDATVTGVADDLLSYPVVVAEGAAVANADVNKNFPFGIPAPDDATDIVVTCPALGAGNTNNQVTIFGFYRDPPAA
jgi:tRNA A37 threonylcarbamoyladenosine synthetase subunit TsaC/SUA5/YrdC